VPRRRQWPQRFLAAFLLFTVTATSVAVAGAFFARTSLDTRTVEVGGALSPGDGPARNYLLVGSDSREGIVAESGDDGGFGEVGGKRSDTMMILRVDPGAGRAAILSLPRDLYVEIAGTGESNRLNAAYPKGPEVLIETIEQNFGIPIHNYLEVDFLGFKNLVDAVGGVTACFDRPTRDLNTGLIVTVPGCYELDGLTALQYTRSRYFETQGEDGEWRQDPTADIGRIQRQQAFMKEAIKQAVSVGLTDPSAIPEFTKIAKEDLLTDPDFDLVSFGAKMRGVDLDDIPSFTPPVDGDTVDGNSVLRLRAEEAAPLFALFSTGSLADLPPTEPPAEGG
jgi:LCP family protein required for cell wall assembly